MQCFHIQLDKQNEDVTILEELPQKEDCFYTFEYMRHQKKMIQIGVRIKEATKIICQQFNQTIASLVYHQEKDIWYHQPKTWRANNYMERTDSLFGFNAGGAFQIQAYQHDKLIEENTVIITPGTMSLEEYIEMQEDVRHLIDLFSYDLSDSIIEENQILKNIQLPLYSLNTFENIVVATEQLLSAIEKNPQQQLTTTIVKMDAQKIKKWRPKTILSASVNPFKKIRTEAHIATTNITEHRIIRKMLLKFSERIMGEKKHEQRLVQQFIYKSTNIRSTAKNAKSIYIKRSLEKQLASLKEDILQLEKRYEKWTSLEETIMKLLSLPFLKDLPEEKIKETFLFRMHPQYSEIYNYYLQYEALQPEYTEVLETFMQSILKSPKLYEFWILLKLISYLSEWGLQVKTFMDALEEKLKKDQSLTNLRIPFTIPNRKMNMAIWYDYEVAGKSSKLRPDFIIGFQYKQKWSLHALDAKYKPYHNMKNGELLLKKDLLHSCTRYVNQYPKTILSAALIHPDLNGVDWNIKDTDVNKENAIHRYAHFYFTPHHQENFTIYLRMILHELSHLQDCCPNCGRQVDGQVQLRNSVGNLKKHKTTYICPHCEEVWVANYCSNCTKLDDPSLISLEQNGKITFLPKPLYKYATHNYNVQVANTWNVHCPICSSTAKKY